MPPILSPSTSVGTHVIGLVVSAGLLVLLTLLRPSPVSGQEGKLIITGASTMAPLVSAIGKRFEGLHANIQVDVQTGGSSRGIADTLNGLADIGMVSRDLKPQERHLHGTVVAHDGIGIIVHQSNRVPELTDDQIQSIYTGHIVNWNQVGGPDAMITVVNKAEGRSTLELFLHYFTLSNRDIRPHVIIGDNEQGIKTVAGQPHAIGYVSLGTARYSATHGVPIRLLPLHGVPATLETVQAGTFPLTRPLLLVTQSPPKGLIKTFIDFSASAQVHDLILKHFFVPNNH